MPNGPTQFGAFIGPHHAVDDDPARCIDRDMELVERLDRLGFDEAWIEIGKGSDPDSWKKVSKTIKRDVIEEGLDELEVKHFAGANQWTLRLIGKHKNGQQREARFVLDLG